MRGYHANISEKYNLLFLSKIDHSLNNKLIYGYIEGQKP